MISKSRAYLYLHLAVFLWGFTAILGALISLSAFWLVWWRVGITSFSLSINIKTINAIKKLSMRIKLVYACIGVLIALHWLTFFGSIKYANASVALIAMSTSALFTAFIEPFFTKERIKKTDILFGIAVIPGMSLIVKDLNGHMLIGLSIGLFSAFLAATFAVLNKHYINESEPAAMTFLELSSSWVFLSFLIPVMWLGGADMAFIPQGMDWIYLLILGLLCTNLTFILHFKALRHISAFVSNLVINLEPVYGIIMAALILGDYKELNSGFYIGVLMILALVAIYPLVNKNKNAISIDSVVP